MPGLPSSSGSTEEKKNTIALNMRRVIGDAYSFILSQQKTRSIAAMSIEQLIDAHIESIEGRKEATDIRPNKLEVIENIRNSLDGVIEEAKALPPQYFDEERPSDTANTDEEGSQSG